MNNDDTRAVSLLDLATSDLTPDVDRLVVGGISRGRARRRRRRVGTALAAVAVIGVTGVAASVLPGLVDQPSTPAAADHEEVVIDSPRRFAMAPDETGEVLASLMPAGRITHVGWGSDLVDSDLYRDGALNFNGGKVRVRGEWVDHRDDEVCDDLGCHDLGNGDRLLVTRGQDANSVILYFADGWSVGASATNFRETPDDEPVAKRPVLTVAQLKAIVFADVWFE